MNYRIEKIRELLESDEAAVIFDYADRFYLTGFCSSDGIVFITKARAYFLIDFRYYEKASKTVEHFEVVLLENSVLQLESLIKDNKIKNLFTVCDKIELSRFLMFNGKLSAKIKEDNKIGELIYALRSKKTPREISLIKEAQSVTDATFEYILSRIDVGRSEKDIALDMEFFLKRNGADAVAFDFIVVSGNNSSLPHGVPTDKKIEKGDFITMDFGAEVNGYRSDMTRTVCMGNASSEQKEVYKTVLKAQEIAFGNINPNVKCSDVDKAAREYIEKLYPGCFGHGLGHSVGIDIHENPSFSTRCDTILQQGMVLTVEPGIYLRDKFGVRIEDMVVITETGFENITKSRKELIEL